MMLYNKLVHIAFNPDCMLFIAGEDLKPNRTLKIIDSFGRPLVAMLYKKGDGGEKGKWDGCLVKPPDTGCYFLPILQHPRFDPNNSRVISEEMHIGEGDAFFDGSAINFTEGITYTCKDMSGNTATFRLSDLKISKNNPGEDTAFVSISDTTRHPIKSELFDNDSFHTDTNWIINDLLSSRDKDGE